MAVPEAHGPATDLDGRKRTLASRVSSDLRQAILRGDMPPGGKVDLDRIRETYGISVSPLREALARLAADRLVEFEDQRGWRVTTVSFANLEEITPLRVVLAALALGLAIERGSLDREAEVLAALYKLNRIKRGPAQPATIEAWEVAQGAFHVALIRGSAMPSFRHHSYVSLRADGVIAGFGIEGYEAGVRRVCSRVTKSGGP